jgi:hypothetical protein
MCRKLVNGSGCDPARPLHAYQGDTLCLKGVAGIEEMMRKSGLGEIESIRPARELFLDSRCALGKMLQKVPRAQVRVEEKEGEESRFFKALLEQIKLDPDHAKDAQRIGILPVKEKTKAYAEAKTDEIIPTISLLIDVARYWYRPIAAGERYSLIIAHWVIRSGCGSTAALRAPRWYYDALDDVFLPSICPDDCWTGSCGLWRLSRFELPWNLKLTRLGKSELSRAAAAVTHLNARLPPVTRLPPRSSCASLRTAGAAGLLILSQ